MTRTATIALLVASVLSLLAGCGGKLRTAPDEPPQAAAGASAEEVAATERQRAEWFKAKADREATEAAKASAARAQAEAAKSEALAAAAKAAREAQEAANELNLGKAAAHASIAKAAGRVGILGFMTGAGAVLVLVFGAFFGGIGRTPALVCLGASAGCVWLEFFLRRYGVIVSEGISWTIMVGAAAAAIGAAAWAGSHAYRLVNARGLAKKRAANGQDAADAIALMPVSRPIKKALHDAYTYLLDPATGDALSEAQAEAALKKYGIPTPTTK